MKKQIELLKKLKALADRGVGGEKVNAQRIFDAMLKKHGLSIEDIEGEEVKEYYFKAAGDNAKLLNQIIKRVDYNLKIWEVKGYYGGSLLTKCTASQYIEICQMYDVYKRLYKQEIKIFYHAFLAANDLLAHPPKEITKADLTPAEIEELRRVYEMAGKIKKETIRKRLNAA